MTAMSTSQLTFGKNYGGTAPENYERFFVPAIGAPLAQDLIAEANLRIGDRVLDVACGTGVIARLAAERVGSSGMVSGVDINAGMLGVARAVSASAVPAIKWYESTAESIPIPKDSFDVVICQLGLMFMPDKKAAVSEMHRVLARDGRALVSVPTSTAFFNVFENALARHLPAGAVFVSQVFSLNDSAHIQALFRDAGFREVTSQRYARALRLPSPRDFLWQYILSTPLVGLVADASDATLGALELDVVTGWQAWLEGDGLTYEQPMIVTTARK
jgi:ubiquinone/menaquinone biosynthesis C-methylase UbiE